MKIYYTVEKCLEGDTYTWNGLRIIRLYKWDKEKEIFTIFNDLIAKTDGDYNYLYSDKEEILIWLVSAGYEDKKFDFIRL